MKRRRRLRGKKKVVRVAFVEFLRGTCSASFRSLLVVSEQPHRRRGVLVDVSIVMALPPCLTTSFIAARRGEKVAIIGRVEFFFSFFRF